MLKKCFQNLQYLAGTAKVGVTGCVPSQELNLTLYRTDDMLLLLAIGV